MLFCLNIVTLFTLHARMCVLKLTFLLTPRCVGLRVRDMYVLRLWQCWCGGEDTEVTKYGESTACSYECPGDPDQTCGGGWAISVFETFAES